MKRGQSDGADRLRAFLIERRHHLSFRQQDVAERSGLSLGWVTSFEVGRLKKVPRKDTLIKLSQALHLPEETPGRLYNFMEFVAAGALDSRKVHQVAVGRLSPIVAMIETSSSIVMISEGDLSESIFANEELRQQRFEQIIALLRIDLSPQDFTLAKLLLQRLYQQESPRTPETSARSAPRRRKSTSTANRGESHEA